MVSKGHRQAITRAGSRPATGGTVGGLALPEYLRLGANGTIQIDSLKLDMPQSTYDADYLWVRRRGESVSFYFGKENPDKPDELLTRVEVRYSPEAFVNHFWKLSREFYFGLKRRAELRAGLTHDEPRADPEKMTAQRSTSMWANISIMSRSGCQASIFFFHLAPEGIAQLAANKTTRFLSVEPMLRVLTTTDELLRLLDRCEPLARELEPWVDKAEAL